MNMKASAYALTTLLGGLLTSACLEAPSQDPQAGLLTLPAYTLPAPLQKTDFSQDDLLVVMVHGIQTNGFMSEGVFGLEATGYYHSSFLEAGELYGMVRGDQDPTALPALSAVEYYGSEPPPYWTEADLSTYQALEATYGGGIPSYAFIVARFARYRLEQTGAGQLAFVAHSMGGAITRWIIEHDLEGLASSGVLNRWMPMSGVVQGDLITEWIPEPLMATVGTTSEYIPPEFHQLDQDWLDQEYEGDASIASNPLYAGILQNHVVTTDPVINGYDMSFAFYGQANDSVVSSRDMTFDAVEPETRFMTAQGEALEPAVCELSFTHNESKDSWSTAAHLMALLFGHRRITITLEDYTPLLSGDGREAGEYFYDATVVSPYWVDASGSDGLLQETRYADRLERPVKLSTGETASVEARLFDMPVVDEETSLTLTLRLAEVDCFRHWGILESCKAGGSSSDFGETDLGTAVLNIPLTPGRLPLQGASFGAVLRVEVHQLYP